MRELPILFKTEMVRAILSGQKTQTRRLKGLKVVNENPDEWSLYSNKLKWNVAGKRQFWFERKIKPICRGKWIDQQAACTGGDQLWVKETWQEEVFNSESFVKKGCYIYKADNEPCDKNVKWKSSLFMPKTAARIWLEVTDVRVERLNDISEEDAIREGVNSKAEFASLWESINGQGSWAKNPYVFVYEFKLIKSEK